MGGQNNFDWLKGVIQDAQEVVPGEIWRVSIQKSDGSRPEAIYVLEATCEVVGYSSDDLSSIQEEKTTVMGNARALRADWTTYIQQQVSNHRQGNAVQSLLSHLKWANYEEYNRGISKLWLTRIASESLLGLAKKVVAERYVLACVVDNRCVDICF